MAIEFITGVPGGGKSYAAVKLVVRELREGKRNICTNLALDIPRLCEFLHEKYGDSCDASRRVRILTMQECAEFWLYRGVDRDIDPAERTEVKVKSREKLSLNQIDYEKQGIGIGVLFIIDEVHVMFGAREWATTGNDALYYLTQHRKFSDDVILVSQHTKQVEGAFTRMCETFYHCKNLSKWKLPVAGGFFRAPPLLIISEYKEASSVKPPIATRTYTIDKMGIGSCYRTAAGVGFVGSMADTEDKPRGLPAWALVLCLVCVMLGVWKLGKYAIASTIGSKQVTRRAVFSGTLTNQVKPIVAPGVAVPVPDPLPVQIQKKALESMPVESTNVFIVAHTTYKGDKWYLSDGRKLLAADPRFKMANDEVVIFGDVVYKWTVSVAGNTNSPVTTGRYERK